MYTHCTPEQLHFHAHGRREVIARFDGGRITSDAGGMLLRETDLRLGLMARLARCFRDYRKPGSVEHPVRSLVAQRVYALALGYEDLNDHEELRRDTLFPLQGALGYEISQSLFVGKNTLLVEGPSDILYIQALSDVLNNQEGRTGLDQRWTICPAGGIDKIQPFVALFSGNALHVAVLSDQARGDKTKIEKIKNSEILRAGHFYTVADFLERAEADIEDMFEPEVFVAILNGCYGLKDTNKLTVEKLKTADTTTERLVKQAEAAFRVMPETIPMFDHFRPAAWLIRNSMLLEKKSTPIAQTLDCAEKIFKTYNALL